MFKPEVVEKTQNTQFLVNNIF